MKNKIAFCFDLDGTLTHEEILPQIAKKIGIYEEIDLLTKLTMDGLITFDSSFKLRVKLLASVSISTVSEVVQNIRIDPLLQSFVQQNKEHCYIVTGNLDVWVNAFIKEKYGCEYFSSVARHDGDQLIGISKIIQKSKAVLQLKEKYETIIAIGDGMNDCSMFEKADKGIAYGGIHQPVISLIKSSDYVCYNPKSLVTLLESFKNQHS